MTTRFSLVLTTVVLMIALSGILRVQVNLPDTRQGNTVRDFIAPFNSGDDATMRQFFLANVSKEGLADRPADARVERMKMFRNDVKSLTLLKLLDTSATSMAVLAKSAKGETLTLTFNFDPTPQHKFVGLNIEMGEEEPTGGPPIGKKEFLKAVEGHLDAAVREGKFSAFRTGLEKRLPACLSVISEAGRLRHEGPDRNDKRKSWLDILDNKM